MQFKEAKCVHWIKSCWEVRCKCNQVFSTPGQLQGGPWFEFGSDPPPETLHKFAEEYDPQKISKLVKPTQHPPPV